MRYKILFILLCGMIMTNQSILATGTEDPYVAGFIKRCKKPVLGSMDTWWWPAQTHADDTNYERPEDSYEAFVDSRNPDNLADPSSSTVVVGLMKVDKQNGEKNLRKRDKWSGGKDPDYYLKVARSPGGKRLLGDVVHNGLLKGFTYHDKAWGKGFYLPQWLRKALNLITYERNSSRLIMSRYKIAQEIEKLASPRVGVAKKYLIPLFSADKDIRATDHNHVVLAAHAQRSGGAPLDTTRDVCQKDIAELAHVVELLGLADVDKDNVVWDEKHGFTFIDTENIYQGQDDALEEAVFFPRYRKWLLQQEKTYRGLNRMNTRLAKQDLLPLSFTQKGFGAKLWKYWAKKHFGDVTVLARYAMLAWFIRHLVYVVKIKKRVNRFERAMAAAAGADTDLREQAIAVLKKELPKETRPVIVNTLVTIGQIYRNQLPIKERKKALMKQKKILKSVWHKDVSWFAKIGSGFKKLFSKRSRAAGAKNSAPARAAG